MQLPIVLRMVVQGEWNGYQYKVPMDYHRKVDKMNDRELNRHSKAVKKSIEEEIERQTKVRASWLKSQSFVHPLVCSFAA